MGWWDQEDVGKMQGLNNCHFSSSQRLWKGGTWILSQKGGPSKYATPTNVVAFATCLNA